MRRLLSIIFLFTLIVTLWTSCSYNYAEDYYNDIELVNPNINLSLTGLSEGDILTTSQDVQYAITGSGSSRGEVTIRLDNDILLSETRRFGEFFIDLNTLSDGDHTITIDYLFPTNSGSLADALQAEVFVGSTSYSFTVNKSLADPFGIESIDIIQGSIFINLNPVTDPNFDQAYLLIKNNIIAAIEEIPITPQQLATGQIHDAETTYYNPSYAIKVVNQFEEKISNYVVLPTPEMEFEIEPLTYRSLNLTYNGHLLYGNFDRVGMQYSYPSVGGYVTNLIPTGGTTTITNSGFRFGRDVEMRLRLYKNSNLIREKLVNAKLGDNFPIVDFSDLIYVSSLNRYYALKMSSTNNLIIYQVNSSTLIVEGSRVITNLNNIEELKSLELLTFTNQLIINMKSKAVVFDPSSFSISQTIDATDYNTNKPNAIVHYRNDYIILEDESSNGEVIIYEKTTNLEKYRTNKTTNFFSASDASHLYVNGDLYQLQGGNFTFLRTVRDSRNNIDAPPLTHMTFDTDTNTAILGWYRNTYFLDLSTSSQTYLFGYGVVYDVHFTENGKALINSNHFSAGNRSHLYDPVSSQSREIDIYNDNNRYYNGNIFSPSGLYLNSDLYIN